MTTATKWQKLISRIKRADDIGKKNKIWDAAHLLRPEAEQVVGQMILSLPPRHYKVHDKQYGINIVEKIYEMYGTWAAAHVSERLLLGLQALYPERVYASFTHGLDAVEIKQVKRSAVSTTRVGLNKSTVSPTRAAADTPGRGRIVAGVGYADKGAKRMARKPRKGWKKVKFT